MLSVYAQPSTAAPRKAGTKEPPLRRIPAPSAHVPQRIPRAACAQVAQRTLAAFTPALKHHQTQQRSAPVLEPFHGI